jgi:hypothetical protein
VPGGVALETLTSDRGTQRVQANWHLIGFFEKLIAQDPDITLSELHDALADAARQQVLCSAISHLRKRLGFTHKKVAGRHRAPQRQGQATK